MTEQVDQYIGIHVGDRKQLRPRVIDWGEHNRVIVRWDSRHGGFLRNYIHVRM